MTCFIHRMPLLSVLFLLVVIWPFSTRAAEWAVSVDERSGLPQVTRGGSPAVASQFVFWGGNWDWADFTPSLKVISPYVYAMEGKSQRLDFDATGQIRKEDEQTLSIDLVLNAHSMKSNASCLFLAAVMMPIVQWPISELPGLVPPGMPV